MPTPGSESGSHDQHGIIERYVRRRRVGPQCLGAMGKLDSASSAAGDGGLGVAAGGFHGDRRLERGAPGVDARDHRRVRTSGGGDRSRDGWYSLAGCQPFWLGDDLRLRFRRGLHPVRLPTAPGDVVPAQQSQIPAGVAEQVDGCRLEAGGVRVFQSSNRVALRVRGSACAALPRALSIASTEFTQGWNCLTSRLSVPSSSVRSGPSGCWVGLSFAGVGG